jgi:hypothetical protein
VAGVSIAGAKADRELDLQPHECREQKVTLVERLELCSQAIRDERAAL